MAPKAIRHLFATGVVAAAVTATMSAAEKPATPAPVVDPSPVVAAMPGPDATHAEFATWLRTTDLGTMLRRDESAYTIERSRAGTIMRLNGPAFREVLVMKITKAGGEALPVCIGSEAEAEAILKDNRSETEKP